VASVHVPVQVKTDGEEGSVISTHADAPACYLLIHVLSKSVGREGGAVREKKSPKLQPGIHSRI